MPRLSPELEVALGLASVVMFIATVLAVPFVLVRIPDDFFARPRKPRALPVKILRTVAGLALIALGLTMIVLPGQGVLTILVGLSILDLPIKHRLMLKILRVPSVHRAIDNLRRKRGRGAIQLPDSSPTPVAA